ncbi:unnamed protein product, partial [Adineta steineri]
MSVCQHYLRGNCRYGDQCQYPHVKPNVPNPATSAILKWITENYADKMKAFDILVQMQTEAKVWLKTSLWRFTSRSLFPGGHPLKRKD